MVDPKTLVLVTVLFRHGDRTPDTQNGYPTDKYKDQSFFPYKLGEVTKKGQARMIEIGGNLRDRYDAFLGDEFYTDMIKSTSSSYTRCQMSMQCVHAGMFPPSGLCSLSQTLLELQWQAVPFDIIPFDQDKFISLHMLCPQIMDNIDPEVIPEEDKSLLDYVCKQAGFDKPGYIKAMRLNDYFKTCIEAGLAIPEWAIPIYPDQLKRVAYTYWYHFQNKRQRFAGPLIKRITEEAKMKVAEENIPNGRKVYLYAVHDMTLHLLLGALHVWKDEPIDYGAHMIFELHQIQCVYGFKIYYQNSYEEPKLVVLPGYGEFIGLDDFEKVTKCLYQPELTCADIIKSCTIMKF